MSRLLAACLYAAGDCRVAEIPPLRPPGFGEVLLAMRLAPVNPADMLTIDGNYSIAISLPAVLGAEGVGEVIAVGEGVRNVALGDYAIPLSRGNWATQRLLPAAELIRVPDHMKLAEAAMLRINPATAWRLLAAAKLQAGDCAVQSGGNTHVARLLTCFAGNQGIRMISLRRFGQADDPKAGILADGPDLAARVSALTGNVPIAAAFDCVAGETSGHLGACLAPGGRLIVYGHLSGIACQIPSPLLTGKGITVSGFSLRPAETGESPAQLQQLYTELAAQLRNAEPLTRIAATLPLSRLDEALAQAGANAGRVMLKLDE